MHFFRFVDHEHRIAALDADDVFLGTSEGALAHVEGISFELVVLDQADLESPGLVLCECVEYDFLEEEDAEGALFLFKKIACEDLHDGRSEVLLEK